MTCATDKFEAILDPLEVLDFRIDYTLPLEENLVGIVMALTFAEPSASTAIAVTTALSIPPETKAIAFVIKSAFKILRRLVSRQLFSC